MADQKAAIEKELHKAENANLLMEKAQRSLSTAEFLRKKEKSEIDALKATIEKLKLEKLKQEQKYKSNEKLLKERIKRQSIQINQLEELLLRLSTGAESDVLKSVALNKEREKSKMIYTENFPCLECNYGENYDVTYQGGHTGNLHSANNSSMLLPHRQPTSPKIGDFSNKIVTFSNGDAENVLEDGTVIYYYAEIDVSKMNTECPRAHT